VNRRACGVKRILPKEGPRVSVASDQLLNCIDPAQLHHPLVFFFLPRPIGFANKPLSVSCLASINRAVIVGAMARYTRKAAAERFEASTASTSPSVSSVPFSNSNTGSTANTPATSGEDEEGFNLQRKVVERVMRTRGIRRKRSAESDGDDLSSSTRPTMKRRAAMKAVCVEIPVWSANVSMGITLTLMVLRLILIAYLKISKDKGKGRAPSNLVDGVEDNVVPDSEANLNDELAPPSDDDDSEFEACKLDSEDEDEDDGNFTLRNGRKLPRRRSSRAPLRRFHDVEEEEDFKVKAAIKESIRGAVNGGASTSTSPTSRNISRRVANAAAFTEHRSAVEDDFGVVSDSDPEGEVMIVTDTEDEPIVQRSRLNMGKGRGKNEGPEKTERDADSIRRAYIADRKEARRLSRLEKQEIRMLETKLGRRLTHVGLASHFYT